MDAASPIALPIPFAILYLMGYNKALIEIRRTAKYDKWFKGLRDATARARINARLRRVELGLFGDVEPAGGGVSELRIDYGPGYRVYLVRRGAALVVLLGGGDKRTQDADIKAAQRLAAQL